MLSVILYGIAIVVGLVIVTAPFRSSTTHHIDHNEYCACPECCRSHYVRQNRPVK